MIRAAVILLIAIAALWSLAILADRHPARAQGLFGGVFQRPASVGACSNSLDFSATCNSMYVAFPGV